jgi:hypothetical protein
MDSSPLSQPRETLGLERWQENHLKARTAPFQEFQPDLCAALARCLHSAQSHPLAQMQKHLPRYCFSFYNPEYLLRDGMLIYAKLKLSDGRVVQQGITKLV